MRRQLALWAAVALLTAMVTPAVSAAGPPEPISQLPSGEQWLTHFVRDIVPYFSSPEALGRPVGRFPTFRYPDGEPIAGGELLRPDFRSLEEAPWLGLRLDRTYTRMVSRQTYVLGVAYHLTGDARYLVWAKAGVDHILRDLADGEGSYCSWVERGACLPAPPQRTAQDLAYALLGPAFYAYLTQDPEVLQAVALAQRSFFARYRDPQTGLLRWVLEAYEDPPDRHAPGQVEIVAQLDPINSYLLLLAPVMPEAERERWRSDLSSLSRLLLTRFYDVERNVFWGRIDAPELRRLGGHHHTDVGHTSKALWMLLRTGALLGDKEMERIAREGGLRLVDSVFRPEAGAWSDGWNEDGSLKTGASWWAFAEVDQLAATLALAEPRAARHLPRTYELWFTNFVDHHHGGVWPFPIPPGQDPPVLKAHLWKNGYHEAEHALVGYITSNALRKEPVHLFFAPATGQTPAVRPYYFAGEAETVRRLPLPQLPGRERLEVRFRDIR